MFKPGKTKCCLCAFYKSNGNRACKGIDSYFCKDLLYCLWQITCCYSKCKAGDIAGKPCVPEYRTYCLRDRCGRADIFFEFLSNPLFYDIVVKLSRKC